MSDYVRRWQAEKKRDAAEAREVEWRHKCEAAEAERDRMRVAAIAAAEYLESDGRGAGIAKLLRAALTGGKE